MLVLLQHRQRESAARAAWLPAFDARQGARLLAKLYRGARGAGLGGVEAVRRVGLGRHPHPSYKLRLTEMLGTDQLAEFLPTTPDLPATGCAQGGASGLMTPQRRRHRALAQISDPADVRRQKRHKGAPE